MQLRIFTLRRGRRFTPTCVGNANDLFDGDDE